MLDWLFDCCRRRETKCKNCNARPTNGGDVCHLCWADTQINRELEAMV